MGPDPRSDSSYREALLEADELGMVLHAELVWQHIASGTIISPWTVSKHKVGAPGDYKPGWRVTAEFLPRSPGRRRPDEGFESSPDDGSGSEAEDRGPRKATGTGSSAGAAAWSAIRRLVNRASI